jgi:hypothetical protein
LKHDKFAAPVTVKVSPMSFTHSVPPLALTERKSGAAPCIVLNAVTEHFVAGHIKQDAGLPVTRVRYALFLTCEMVGDERIRKVRAMLIRQDVLENFPYADAMPQLENHWHDVRVKTLRRAAELYKKEPDNFLTLEVCV